MKLKHPLMLRKASSGSVDIGDNIANSLMLDSASSQYLSRTQTAGDTAKWTFSTWLKPGKLGVSREIFNAGTGSSDQTVCRLETDSLRFACFVGGSTRFDVTTSAVIRDPAAWHHIVFVLDTANGTAADRNQIWVNGLRATVTGTNWTSGTTPHVNATGVAAAIGRTAWGAFNYGDNYLANSILSDGQAPTASDFGRTSADTGQWVNKTYTGTYGNNGFKLDFANSADLGNDVSGNNNDWTTNGGISSANQYTDTPTNNYGVMSNLVPSTATTSVGNLKQVTGTAGGVSSWVMTAGKWVAEAIWTANNGPHFGVIPSDKYSANIDATAAVGAVSYLYSTGNKLINAVNTAYGASYAIGAVIRIELDLDTVPNTVTFFKNGSSQGAINLPVNGGSWRFFCSTNSASTVTSLWNFGQCANTFNGTATTYRSGAGGYFIGTPTSGYLAPCTANLPTPAIIKGALHFNAKTRTGNGGTATVSGELFQPDLVWTKGRSGATDHAIYDSVRGVQKQLESNTTTAESTETTGLTAFNSDGFTAGALAQMNTNTATYIDWMWKGGGAAVTNNAGSITSSVSANTTAGISIVSFTTPASLTASSTIGHGLTTAPKLIITKYRNGAQSWDTFHDSVGNTKRMILNLTDAASTADIKYWNNTSPTTSVFSIGSTTWWSNSFAYVALCFSEVEGFSKAFSYTGNASTDGAFVYCGFKPRWILIKDSTTAALNWFMFDTARGTYNIVPVELYANLSNAEGTDNKIDILSNGFKVRTSSATINTSSATIIGFAFAEAPFKYATGR